MPGPLFTFAAYLGAVMRPPPNGWLGAAMALVAIFLPSFLLVIGALPFWDALRAPAGRPGGAARDQRGRGRPAARGAVPAGLDGAILTPADFALGLAAFGLLAVWVPPWLVVVLTAAGGALLARV